ncbi:hypothetical protein LEP1GSC074_3850 [Leptospira noguchii str. Hook]|nr:hypothetical protein LEP1GSC041_2229 [Leptospira noguchii str. 2006001870]EMI62679.1 hypothetical protein LEP1GSC072_1317 [Leptospira noguchii str. Bonito]EMS83190.1 hypothetical protein LEP1GSC073_1641 [Leptospira noguchii str. Cascata]EMS87206.1 hypothetical protein LEP1GSC074_3850 [Leptospira noguchii str. Hook]
MNDKKKIDQSPKRLVGTPTFVHTIFRSLEFLKNESPSVSILWKR